MLKILLELEIGNHSDKVVYRLLWIYTIFD